MDKHVYVSAGCFHERHDLCSDAHGAQGRDRPAMCKFCKERCACPCHRPEGEV